MLGDRVEIVRRRAPTSSCATRRARATRWRRSPTASRVPTILLVDDPHADLALAALRAGASAVLARQSDAANCSPRSTRVRAGLVVLDAAVRDALAPAATARAAAPAEPLTERERQVLAMLAERLVEPPHRRAARDQREHGQGARRRDPGEARRDDAHRSRHARRTARPGDAVARATERGGPLAKRRAMLPTRSRTSSRRSRSSARRCSSSRSPSS